MDQLTDDIDYKGLGCNISYENLDHWRSEDQNYFKDIVEVFYKRQLIGSWGHAEKQTLDEGEG